jgi:hypothetical protein
MIAAGAIGLGMNTVSAVSSLADYRAAVAHTDRLADRYKASDDCLFAMRTDDSLTEETVPDIKFNTYQTCSSVGSIKKVKRLATSVLAERDQEPGSAADLAIADTTAGIVAVGGALLALRPPKRESEIILLSEQI